VNYICKFNNTGPKTFFLLLRLNTVNVRKPDVRFGEPDRKLSGFQMSGYRTSGSLTKPPDFRSIQLPERSKSGQYCPVIGRPVEFNRPITGQYCPDFRRSNAETGLEPVPIVRIDQNRFRTGLSIQLPKRSKSGQYCPDFERWYRTSDNRMFGNMSLGCSKSGQYCPDFERYLKSGGIYNRTTLESAENRTSGFRTFTVFTSFNIILPIIPYFT